MKISGFRATLPGTTMPVSRLAGIALLVTGVLFLGLAAATALLGAM